MRQPRVLLGVLLAGLMGFGLTADDYLLDVAVLVGIYSILGLGLSIVIGQAGLLDLGYIAFYAIGAYWTALVSTHFGVPFWSLLLADLILDGASEPDLAPFSIERFRGRFTDDAELNAACRRAYARKYTKA